MGDGKSYLEIKHKRLDRVLKRFAVTGRSEGDVERFTHGVLEGLGDGWFAHDTALADNVPGEAPASPAI